MSSIPRKLLYIENKIRSALRRILLPIPPQGLVIDIGSGGTPSIHADVLVDFNPEDVDRADPLLVNKHFVWASAAQLPFKNGAFSYSILSHVLEHVNNPDKVLNELQRISSAGYIETPNSFWEIMSAFTFHTLWVSNVDQTLHIHYKKNWNETPLSTYLGVQSDAKQAFDFVHQYNSYELLTCYHWKNKISYIIDNEPPEKFETPYSSAPLEKNQYQQRSWLKAVAIQLIYKYLGRQSKLQKLETILCCPACQGELVFTSNTAVCLNCKNEYSQKSGYWDFRITNKLP